MLSYIKSTKKTDEVRPFFFLLDPFCECFSPIFPQKILGTMGSVDYCKIVTKREGQGKVTEIFIDDLGKQEDLIILSPGQGDRVSVSVSVRCPNPAYILGVSLLGKQTEAVFIDKERKNHLTMTVYVS